MIGDSLEDFLEVVYLLKNEDWAETGEVAKKIGIKDSSAFVSAGKLAKMGLIEQKEHFQHVKLTKTGIAMAKDVAKKHQILKTFFIDFLCVPEEIAYQDAHFIEHVISDETLEKMVSFLESIKTHPDCYSLWFEEMRKECKI